MTDLNLFLLGTHEASVDWCRRNGINPRSPMVSYITDGTNVLPRMAGHYGKHNLLLVSYCPDGFRGRIEALEYATSHRFTVL